MIYTMNYSVQKIEQLKVNINDLAELVFNDFVSDGSELDIDWILNYFNDNMEFFLRELGLPEDVEPSNDQLDEVYDDISPDLEKALIKLIGEYEADNNRSNNN